MTRPLRIEFPGAIYHVTSRGDRQEHIFIDDEDCQRFLAVVAHGVGRLDAEVLSFCLMGNHYHLVLRTRQANLSRLMRHINGNYTQAFNKRYGLTGHLFQGRFKAILVDSDSYFMELCRYVELNPVRAGLVKCVGDWAWSSYRAHVGCEISPKWLATSALHAHVLGREPASIDDHRQAAQDYAHLVDCGVGVDLWKDHLRQHIYLGSDRFIANMQMLAQRHRSLCPEIPRAQRTRTPSLHDWRAAGHGPDECVRLAYSLGGMTMSAIARQAGLSIPTVSRLITQAESVVETPSVRSGPANPGTLKDLAP